MARDPEIAVFATHVAPALGYGGVSVMAATLTKAFASHARKIWFCASNASLGGALRPVDVKLGGCVEVLLYRSYWFRRWGFGLGAIPKVLALCRRVRYVYIHGIATWPTTLAAIGCVLLRRHFVVAPRGGLMPEHVALIRRKKWHKWLYYQWLTLPTLRRAAAIHCTCDLEMKGVTALLGDTAPVFIVPNGVPSKETVVQSPPAFQRRVLCFLGHIQREKGINAFLRVWLQCRGQDDRVIVAGHSVDDTYFGEFQRLVAVAEGAIDYRGYLGREEVAATLAASHFLVFPSGFEEGGGMRENFGNVVAEALAAGRPALVTRGLAWDSLEAAGAGLLFDRSPESLADRLRRIGTLTPTAWQAMSHRARGYAEQCLDADALGFKVWQVLTAPVSGLQGGGVGVRHA